MHKASRRHTWRKLSLLIDPVSQEIIDNYLTSSRTHNSIAAIPMISKLPKSIDAFFGIEAYDSLSIYQALFNKVSNLFLLLVILHFLIKTSANKYILDIDLLSKLQ